MASSSLADVAWQFLDLDQRPTFILAHVDSPAVLYRNPAFVALQQSSAISDECYTKLKDATTSFTITCQSLNFKVRLFATRYEGTAEGAWVGWVDEHEDVLQRPATIIVDGAMKTHEVDTEKAGFCKTLVHDAAGRPRLDWSRGLCPMDSGLNALHYAFLRSVDWSKTPLGPISSWSISFRTSVSAVMAISQPMSIYCGAEAVSIYNQAWACTIAKERHPGLMGATFRTGWPEPYDYLMPLIRRTWLGETINQEKVLFFLNRTIEQEESYFDFTLSPIIDDEGYYHGTFTQAFEKTNEVVRKRASFVTQSLASNTGSAKDFYRDGGFWTGILDAFDDDHFDSPFIILYNVVATTCIFMGGRGLPQSFDSYEVYLDQSANSDYAAVFLPGLRQARHADDFTLQTYDESELQKLGRMPFRGFGRCTAAVTIPIKTSKTELHSFLILGLNHQRPFDGFYKQWITSIKNTLTTSAVRIWHAEEALRSASERMESLQTSDCLRITTRNLKESELLFARTAAAVPVGLVFLDPEGKISWANDAWFKITTVARDKPDGWPQILYHEDRQRVLDCMSNAIKSKLRVSMEFRCGTGGPDSPITWTRNTVDPNFDEDGKLTGYICTLVDISSFKKAEEYQRQLTTDAIESKRQQENFIDFTSHELRNPLSAILQSADEMQTLVEGISDTSIARGILELSETIITCGEHQKKIIDDILNVSKMDAGLFVIEPLPIIPHESLQRTMKMFIPQFKSHCITSAFETTSAYSELCGRDLWLIDPGRLTQILINLVSNAIKFTGQKQGKREVNVVIDASKTRPKIGDNFGPVEGNFSTDSNENISMTNGNSYFPVKDSEDAVYVRVHVKDTGIGISEEWRKVVGQRFQQAPKTHINYGGSGLGLFIARKMAFRLGGELHFDSEAGVGSTFSFYVRAPRAPNTSSPTTPIKDFPTQPTTPQLIRQRTRDRIVSHEPKIPKKLGTGYTVLIVEDNILNQTILRKQLITQGCITQVANNGQEALNIVLEHGAGFTVVLMDMEMPVMDGVKATQKIREMEKQLIGRHVPIIGTSANARVQQIDMMKGAGMDDTIAKPFLILDLMKKIKAVLERLEHT